ncbi:MAG: NAD-dependent DNA ligase LigA [Ignavibacteria bacterium]|nr:NAD-dependent DNA ligase LigA [Ignavibacteria bacterium]
MNTDDSTGLFLSENGNPEENKSEYAAKEEIEKLKEKIKDADYKYYVLAQPDIDDYEYDMMMKELESLEKKYPALQTEDSPTQRVSGEPINIFRTITHKYPMLSLSNSYNFEDLLEFDRRVESALGGEEYEYVCELKFDGIAVSLIYENGKLKTGATRGDGITGDDITKNLKIIKSIPLSVKSAVHKNFEVRGEVFIKKEDFERINEEQELRGEKTFANPRNTAAGTLKLKDSREVVLRPLNIFVYSLRSDDIRLKCHFENLKILEELKFPVNKYYKKLNGINEVKEYCDRIEEIRDTLPYEIDGVVVKIDSLRQQETAGYTSKSPKWAIAYKFKAKQKTTRINRITLQVGRTGTITPVAELEPVFLAGSTISRATLHNFDEIRRKDIREGDIAVIEKGGDVIPKVVEIIKEKREAGSREFPIPELCPVCNSKLERPEGEANIYCINYFCPAQVQGRILHFVQRDAMDIRGLGENITEIFIEKDFLKDITDIYRLKNRREELIKLERFGKKSIDNLLNSIEQSKQKPFEKVLYALGIRHIGDRTAKILAKSFADIYRLSSASAEEVSNVHEIGPKIAESVVKFFKDRKSSELIEKLQKSGLKFQVDTDTAKEEKEGFRNKTFVLTGTLEKYTRTQASELIEKYGGRVSSSVSKKTDFVIAGEEAGSKLDKAKSLGIKIISENEFEKMLL